MGQCEEKGPGTLGSFLPTSPYGLVNQPCGQTRLAVSVVSNAFPCGIKDNVEHCYMNIIEYNVVL